MSQSEETDPLVGDVIEDTEDLQTTEDEDLHTTDDTPLVESPLLNLDLDKLLEERLGEFGRYQKLIYLLICLPAALTAGVTLSSVFTQFSPPHRCFVPGCDDLQDPRYDDAFYLSFYNFTIPSNR